MLSSKRRSQTLVEINKDGTVVGLLLYCTGIKPALRRPWQLLNIKKDDVQYLIQQPGIWLDCRTPSSERKLLQRKNGRRRIQLGEDEFVQKFVSKHGIDTLLTESFQKQVAGRQLPKNPYAGMYRQLSQTIFRRNLDQFFEEVRDRKMLTNSLDQTKSTLAGQLPLSSNQAVYAATGFLTNINRKSCEDLLKQFGKETLNDKRIKQVITSYGGSELLKSQVLPYVDSSDGHIQISHYLRIEGSNASDVFSEVVYAEALNCIRASGSTLLFRELVIQQSSDRDNHDYIWGRSDILLYKVKLLKEIAKALGQTSQVVIRCLQLYKGNFVKVKRRYTLVLQEQGDSANMEIYPLSSVFRSVFTNRQDLDTYLKICNDDESQPATEADMLSLYMAGQSARILQYLSVQDLRKAAWEIFYLCMAQPSPLFQQILDGTVLNILTGDMSEIESIRLQLEVCLERLKAQMFKDRLELEQVLDDITIKLRAALEKGRNSDLLRFREMLAKLSLQCADSLKENNWRQRLQLLLLQLVNSLRFIVMNSDHLEFGMNSKQVKELIDLMQQMSPEAGTMELVIYQQLMKEKQLPEVVLVQQQAMRLRSQLGLRSEAEAADLVHILYFKQFGLFENIYSFYLELFFGGKAGYPLAQLLMAIGEFTFESSYFGEVPRKLQDILAQQPIREITINEDLVIDSIKHQSLELVGYRGCLRCASIEELQRLSELIDVVRLNRQELKLPGNIQLTELFSFSGQDLLSSSSYIQRSITTLYLNIDIVIRGGTQRQVDNIFYEAVLQKCRIIDSSSNMGALGLYSHKDREQNFRLYDPKLPFTSEQFKQFAESNESLHLKSVILVEDRIKIVNYQLNLHFIQSDGTATHLYSASEFDQRHRVFLKSGDILLWSRVLPLKNTPAPSPFYFYEDLDMNAAVKRFLIQSLMDNSKSLQTIFQILHFSSEKMHFLAREILNFYYLLQYVKKDRRGKFEIKQTTTSLEMTTTKITQLLQAYSYCYNQGLSVAIAQHCTMLTDYAASHQQSNGEEKELLALERRTYFLFQMLEHNSQTLHLEYRNTFKRTSPSLTLIV